MKQIFSKIAGIIIVACIIVGFSVSSDNFGSRMNTITENWEPVQNEVDAVAIYTDNFDLPNDTIGLKLRGYKPYRRGTGPVGTSATWFQPVAPPPFPAYNGTSVSYVAANYQTVASGNIDNWLVLPYQSGGYLAGDTLYFYSKAPDASTFPDSIRVMYSVSDSIPEGVWVELGRFKVTTLPLWEQRGFRVPTTSVNGRLAVRYCVVDGGPPGFNSDFIGIDAMRVERNTVGIHSNGSEVPSSYKLEQNYPNPFNPTTNIRFSIPKTGVVKLAVYDAVGNEVEVLVNGSVPAGSYRADFDASRLSSGVYFYKLTGEGFSDTKKMMLVK